MPPEDTKVVNMNASRLNTEEGAEHEERTSLRPPELSPDEQAEQDLENTQIIVMRAKMMRDRGFLLTQMLTVWVI